MKRYLALEDVLIGENHVREGEVFEADESYAEYGWCVPLADNNPLSDSDLAELEGEELEASREDEQPVRSKPRRMKRKRKTK